MKTKALFVAALLLVASVAGAQNTANFTYRYDVDSATLTYCVLSGQNGSAFGGSMPGQGMIETSGSSTTLTGVNASDDAFTGVGVGDVLQIVPPAGRIQELRVVTAVTSVDEVEVNAAVDLTGGITYRWLDLQCGTGLDDGWIDVVRGSQFEMGWGIVVQYDAGDLTGGLAMRIECVSGGIGEQPVIVYPGENDGCGVGGTLNGNQCEFATAGIDSRLSVVNDYSTWSACRVGLAAVTSDTDGTIEDVTVTLVTR